jgi:DNA-binding HxlR family transcriptional regulator
MAAMDLLGRRWALRLLWELRDGPLGPRDVLQRCDGLSSSVLYDRLRELTDAELIARDDRGAYGLTVAGAGLRDALAPLDEWSRQWAAATRASSA